QALEGVRRHVRPPRLEALSRGTPERNLRDIGDALCPLPFPHRPERLDRGGVDVDRPTLVVLRRVESELPCVPGQSLRADGWAEPDRLTLPVDVWPRERKESPEPLPSRAQAG